MCVSVGSTVSFHYLSTAWVPGSKGVLRFGVSVIIHTVKMLSLHVADVWLMHEQPQNSMACTCPSKIWAGGATADDR
jgi:hypothetical protein